MPTSETDTTQGKVVIDYTEKNDVFTVQFSGELLRRLDLSTPLQHALWDMATNHRV